jgi:N-acetylmuramoyl-L-alanine amidase
MGQSWKLPVVETSVQGELMVKADHPSLMGVARALGRDLVWSPSALTVTGDNGLTLALGQRVISGRPLPVAPRMIDESVNIPLSAVEELLSCRVTIRPGNKGAIYVEPTLREICFVDEGLTGTVLRVVTTVPVRKKVSKLSNPPRTVIDLIGVAPSRNEHNLKHPVLGEIKIAQNQPAPSITRIVIPTPSGVKISTPKSFDLFEHRAEVAWKKGQPGAVAAKPAPAPESKPTPIPPVRTTVPSATIKIPTTPPVAQVGENPDSRPEPPSKPAPASTSKRPLLLDAFWQGEQLKLVFSEPVTYRWSRLSAGQHRFVVDFPGVIFPDKRETIASPVAGLQAVRIVQNMPEPNPVVRLVCDLEGPMAVTTVAGEESELFLEFPGRVVSSGGATKGAGNTEKPRPGSVGGRTICLDAGHGGSDPGAISRAYGVTEKQVTLDITLRLAKMLRAEGWNVVLTRSVDRDVSYAGSSDKEELGARSGLANEQKSDLFVSIHCNSAANTGVGGTSIHWFKADDYVLAKSLESEVLVATGRSHRGLIKDRFFVLAHTQMPAVLIETAFISNPTEGKLLANPEYREQIARGIAAGLRGYAAKHFPVSAAGK